MSIFNSNSRPKVKRSHFNLTHERVLSTNFGWITPIYCEEVIPGDKFSVHTELLVKLAPMASPAFTRIDNSIHYFFVPNRLTWVGWERWISGTQTGKNGTSSATADINMPDFPTFRVKSNSNVADLFNEGSLFDYFTGSGYQNGWFTADINDVYFNALPFRAYQLIYDEYYRDENLGRRPIVDQKDGTTGTDSGTHNLRYSNGNIESNDGLKALLQIQYACWRKDYFTSALPWTQRGDVAKLLIDGSISSDISFNGGNVQMGQFQGDLNISQGQLTGDLTGNATMNMQRGQGLNVVLKDSGNNSWKARRADNHNYAGGYPIGTDSNTGNTTYGQGTQTLLQLDPNGTLEASGSADLQFNSPPNEFADLGEVQGQLHVNPSNVSSPGSFNGRLANVVGATVGGITIPDVRRAFQLQRWLERTARAGYRYIEQIFAHFGVISSDKRLDRPEYLGGGHVPTVIGDIYQTSDEGSSSSATPLATRAGHGNAYGHLPGFKNKYIEEHGYIIGLLTSRPRAIYSNGVDRMFLKGANGDRFDYFWPEFAHIGEQSLYNVEIQLKADSNNLATFGYTPRYHEYRFHRSSVHGDFKTSLKFWHQARMWDQSVTRPSLNNAFLECNDEGNYRPFYLTHDTSDHIWCFMTNHVSAMRPVPKFGDPGMADH